MATQVELALSASPNALIAACNLSILAWVLLATLVDFDALISVPGWAQPSVNFWTRLDSVLQLELQRLTDCAPSPNRRRVDEALAKWSSTRHPGFENLFASFPSENVTKNTIKARTNKFTLALSKMA